VRASHPIADQIKESVEKQAEASLKMDAEHLVKQQMEGVAIGAYTTDDSDIKKRGQCDEVMLSAPMKDADIVKWNCVSIQDSTVRCPGSCNRCSTNPRCNWHSFCNQLGK